jgi:hypothetical protein
MDSLSPQRILHKPMTILQVAREHGSNKLQSSFASWLLEKKFFLHYYANTIHTLHIRFYIAKMPLVVEDSLR